MTDNTVIFLSIILFLFCKRWLEKKLMQNYLSDESRAIMGKIIGISPAFFEQWDPPIWPDRGEKTTYMVNCLTIGDDRKYSLFYFWGILPADCRIGQNVYIWTGRPPKDVCLPKRTEYILKIAPVN